MNARLPSITLLILSSCACIDRGRINSSCDWGGEPGWRLHLDRRADQRHLHTDIELAEALGIRYGDAFRRAGLDLARFYRERCTDSLLYEITRRHGVAPEQVLAVRGRRDARVDLGIVLLPIAMLLALVAHRMAGRIHDRFLRDERRVALVATLLTSVAAAAVAAQLVSLWASIVEMIRLDDAHMSYRAFRLPWARHRLALFVGGVVLFDVIAAIRYRRLRKSA